MAEPRDLAEIRKQLLGWYRKFQRELPWRRNKNPYRVWVSEIMLQQTRVAAVLPYYERFLQRFPDIRALAEAPEEEVLRLWSGLGYYNRARNLHQAAQRIVAAHGGEFPRTADAVLALPGIGSYTAAAILSIAFGAKHAVLDGNVVRVLARLDAVRGDFREGGQWRGLQTRADELLDRDSPSDWNQAMMELGAVICAPRAPQCLLCPLSKFCRARQLGLTEVIPEKRKKRATVRVTLAAAVLLDPRGRTLVLAPPPRKQGTQGKVAALVSNMWHFPTVQVASDSTAKLWAFLLEIGVFAANQTKVRLEPLSRARHTVTHRAITVLPYRVRVSRIPRIPGTKSVLLADLVSRSSLAVSNLTRKVAQAALAEFTRAADRRD